MSNNVVKIQHARSYQKAAKRPMRFQDREVERMARMIYDGIERELADLDFFTREDLLQLSCLQSWATITRYNYLLPAVHWLIGSRRLNEISRTELCLPAKRSRILADERIADRYTNTIDTLIRSFISANEVETPFDVMDIVKRWKNDPHLSLNSKRAIVRKILRSYRKQWVNFDPDRNAYTVIAEVWQ